MFSPFLSLSQDLIAPPLACWPFRKSSDGKPQASPPASKPHSQCPMRSHAFFLFLSASIRAEKEFSSDPGSGQNDKPMRF